MIASSFQLLRKKNDKLLQYKESYMKLHSYKMKTSRSFARIFIISSSGHNFGSVQNNLYYDEIILENSFNTHFRLSLIQTFIYNFVNTKL